MKIGVMLRHFASERGGIGRYTQSLLEALLSIDPGNQYVLLYNDRELVGTYSKYSNVEECALSASSRLAWDQVVVPRFARAQKFDLLFNPKLSIPLLAPCKTVLVLHGAGWFSVPENYPLYYQIYHKAAATLYSKKADAIIVVSRDAADRLQQFVKATRRKTVAIHHGVDERFRPIADQKHLAEVREKYHLPERFALYLGKIYPMKNVPNIIRAYARLRDNTPHKLVIAGSPSWKHENELAPIRELGLEKDVIVTGWVPENDLPALYNLADVFMFPSLYEGFGIPLLEAMACGCPVVSSTAGACPEVCGDAAVLVDPTDVEAIARATRDLLADPEAARDLAGKGLRRAALFSWEASARRTLDLFGRVAGETVDRSVLQRALDH